MKKHILYTALTGLAAAAGATAQNGDPVTHEDTLVAVASQAFGLSSEDGELIAGGPGFKATFDAHGIAFVPALGRRAEKNYPLRLSLASIRRGADVVFSATDCPPRHDGSTVVFERAPGLTERFEVSAAGVELSYLFERPLPGMGDVVVQLEVDTDLELEVRAQREDSDGGLRFLRGDLGGVRIGAVTGIDATGRTVRGSIASDGERLDLTLPETFVENAAYPLLLDPLIGLDFPVTQSGNDDLHADLAYNPARGVYLVCWETEFSIDDVDIRGRRILTDSGPLGGLINISVSSTPDVAARPTVANVARTHLFVVAWQSAPSWFGPWDIHGRCVDPDGGVLSAPANLTSSASSETEPDAAGDNSGATDVAVVTWHERETGTEVGRVSVHANNGPSLQAVTTVSPDPLDGAPAISGGGGNTFPNRFCVVWNRPGQGVTAAVVDGLGAVVAGPHAVTTRPEATAVAVDGDGTDFMVAWHQEESGTTPERDVYCQMIRRSGTSLLNIGAAAPVANDPAVDEQQPAVGYLALKYLVAWTERTSAHPLGYDVAARAFDVGGCVPCGPEYSLGATDRYDFEPQIGTQASAGSPDLGALIVYSSTQQQPPFNGEIRGHLFAALGNGGRIAQVDGGCGTPGTWSFNGPAAIGNSEFQFQLTGADPATTTAVFTTNVPVPPFVCGSCSIVPGFLFINVPYTGGLASVELPIPCNETLVGGTLQMQWIMLGGSASPCPLVPNLSTSGRVNVTLGL